MPTPSPADFFQRIAGQRNFSFSSGQELAASTELAATREDEKRRAEGRIALRRPPRLAPVPEYARSSSAGPFAPWDVLHFLGKAIALDRRGAARGMAEHWACLKYIPALTGNERGFLGLSEEGRSPQQEHLGTQARELGKAFGVTLVRHVLEKRHPRCSVTIVPADSVLLAGWKSLTSRKGHRPRAYRPQFFAEAWQPGERSRIYPVVLLGNHSPRSEAAKQLATASVHAETVHIGPWGPTPALICSTSLRPRKGPLTTNALEAPGESGWISATAPPDLSSPPAEVNFPPEVRPQSFTAAEEPESIHGFHIPPEDYSWLQKAVAYTQAAAVSAFAGDGPLASRYLTERQGRKYFAASLHAAMGSTQDTDRVVDGVTYRGTDTVFRLAGRRVEAFSGVAEPVFATLGPGRNGPAGPEVPAFREALYAWAPPQAGVFWAGGEAGLVSVHPDGTVLSLRVMG